MPWIAKVILRRKDPYRISFADGLANTDHSGRLGLLKVLVDQRQVSVVKFQHYGAVADDFLGLVGQLAVERLGPQRADDEEDVFHGMII